MIAAPVVDDVGAPGALAALRAHVAAAGVVHVRQRLDARGFLALCSALGTVWSEVRVHVDPAARRFVLSPQAVPFHTDSARANLCAWLCTTPCRSDVANLYVDARDAFARLARGDQARVARLVCADRMDDRPAGAQPLTPVVTRRRGRPPRFFWLPPALVVPTDAADRAAAAHFAALLAGDPSVRTVGVRLGAGEAVIVDNNRMLHGRGALPADSPRELYRLWIDTDGWAGAAARRVSAVSAVAA